MQLRIPGTFFTDPSLRTVELYDNTVHVVLKLAALEIFKAPLLYFGKRHNTNVVDLFKILYFVDSMARKVVYE